MSNKLKNKRTKKESAVTALKGYLAYLTDGMICIYMLLVIGIMPFYNEEGYARIGTNKSMFFRSISVNGAKFIITAVILYLLVSAVESFQKRDLSNSKHSWKERFAALWQMCRKTFSLTDVFMLLYGVSLLIAYVCSDYKEMALWGAEGWYMGLIPQMFLVGIYFMVSRLWKRRDWMFWLFLPVSAVVFALGYLNRFGIFPIDMKIENPHYISTIGNINWYCGYLVSVFFGGYYLFWQNRTRQGNGKRMNRNILMIAYIAVGFATLVTQGSMSGLVAMAVMLVVTFAMSADNESRMQKFWQGTLILSAVCLVTWFLRGACGWEITFVDPFVEVLTNSVFALIATIVSLVFVLLMKWFGDKGKYPTKLFGCAKWVVCCGAAAAMLVIVSLIVMNTLQPGSIGALSSNAFFTFNPEWGSNRGATWKAGVMCFAEQDILHKLVGVGPDAMEGFIANGASKDLTAVVTERFGTSRLTNAHCEWLTILINEGVLGFVGFAGVIISAITRYIKGGKANVILGACGFCLLAYTVNNIFSFQQSMSVATIYIILGIGEAYAKAYASSSVAFAF